MESLAHRIVHGWHAAMLPQSRPGQLHACTYAVLRACTCTSCSGDCSCAVTLVRMSACICVCHALRTPHEGFFCKAGWHWHWHSGILFKAGWQFQIGCPGATSMLLNLPYYSWSFWLARCIMQSPHDVHVVRKFAIQDLSRQHGPILISRQGRGSFLLC